MKKNENNIENSKKNLNEKSIYEIQKQNDETQINLDLIQGKELKSNVNCSNELEEKGINILEKSIKEKDIKIEKKELEFDNLENEKNKYYIPVCREPGCDGYLIIRISEENYSINCFCLKNKNHKYNNLLFETFERFYLKEKFIQKCSNCNNILENKDIYKCLECDKLYCSSCFLSDLHIRKEWKNLQIITNKCPKDKNEKTYFCKNCQQKVCPFCLKKLKDEEKNPHDNHVIKNIIKHMPTLYEINAFKEEILEKEKSYEEFFKSLDEWQAELIKKIERIKRSLRSEIRILKKLFFNFNQDYMDYNYHNEFHYFFENIENFYINDKKMKKYTNNQDFEVKSEFIFDLLSSNRRKPPEIKNKLKYVDTIGRNGFLENFNDEFLLMYSEMNMKNIIKLISIDYFEEFF